MECRKWNPGFKHISLVEKKLEMNKITYAKGTAKFAFIENLGNRNNARCIFCNELQSSVLLCKNSTFGGAATS